MHSTLVARTVPHLPSPCCLQREKIEKGMKEFGEEDNKDFTDMMNLVEENKLDDDMKLFFKIQRENRGKSPVRDTGGTQSEFLTFILFI